MQIKLEALHVSINNEKKISKHISYLNIDNKPCDRKG